MNLNFSSKTVRDNVFKHLETYLVENNFRIIKKDQERPWGGFFVIDEDQASAFVEYFFPSEDKDVLLSQNKLSPKILIVQPSKRLSWQYHFRRAELWKVIGGKVGIVTSDNDEENELNTFTVGSLIKLQQGERHRLIGLDNWGVVAEIWQHTHADNPSNEDDIVRLQDDFGR